MLEALHPFALSLIIGLLIGIEREYHHKKTENALGVRTFAFLALSGTLAAYINLTYLTIVIATISFALIAISYVYSTRGKGKKPDFGLTTEFAAVIIFCTGFILVRDTRIGTLIGVVTLTLLISREWLHKFIREKLKQNELNAAATLIIVIFGVAPFLPDRTIDPFQLFNPRQLLTLWALIGLIHFAGYAAIRIFGAKAGLALSGLMGGFISSTAVFLQLPEIWKRNQSHENTVMASGLFAVTATFTELSIILFVASASLMRILWLPIASMVVLSSAIALILLARDHTRIRGSEIGQPLDFKAVIKMGILLSSLIALVSLARRTFSETGVWVIALISGFFEMHGATLAVSIDHAKGNLENTAACYAIILAMTASFISKIGILLTRQRGIFAVKLSVLLLGIAGMGIVIFYLRL